MGREMSLIFIFACIPVSALAMDYEPEFATFMSTGDFMDTCSHSPRNAIPGYSNTACADYVVGKRDALLAARRLDPNNCREDAIVEAIDPPPVMGMRVSLTGNSENAVKFAGVISDGEQGKIIVHNSALSANAIVTYDSSTSLYNDISVGGKVVGYGKVIGSAQVTLTSGRATTIPRIKAMCLEGQ